MRLSGQKAEKNYSYVEALGFYQDAITALKNLPRKEVNKKAEIEIYVLMSGTLMNLGYPENSFQTLQEGEKLAKEMNDSKSMALFQMHIAYFYTFRGDTLLGLEYAKNSFEKAFEIQETIFPSKKMERQG